jgi:hypothetical protein
MRVAAITAKVVIKGPFVKVCHGSTKNRRLAGSSIESGTFRDRERGGRLTEENFAKQTIHGLNKTVAL